MLTIDFRWFIPLISDIYWIPNLLAVGVALAIGVVWYHSRVFGTVWMRLANLKPEDVAIKHRAKTALIWQFPILFIIAADMTAFLEHLGWHSAGKGLLFGYNFGMVVALFIGIHYLYEMRPSKLFFITAGYSVVALSAMGFVIGAMF